MAPSPAPAPLPPAPAIVYGVAKVNVVQDFLKKQPVTLRQGLEDAISSLSYLPRPPKSGPMDGAPPGFPLLQWPVETTNPKCTLVYLVDDAKEKVTLYAIQMSVI